MICVSGLFLGTKFWSKFRAPNREHCISFVLPGHHDENSKSSNRFEIQDDLLKGENASGHNALMLHSLAGVLLPANLGSINQLICIEPNLTSISDGVVLMSKSIRTIKIMFNMFAKENEFACEKLNLEDVYKFLGDSENILAQKSPVNNLRALNGKVRRVLIHGPDYEIDEKLSEDLFDVQVFDHNFSHNCPYENPKLFSKIIRGIVC